jgi:hypothetical protein
MASSLISPLVLAHHLAPVPARRRLVLVLACRLLAQVLVPAFRLLARHLVRACHRSCRAAFLREATVRGSDRDSDAVLASDRADGAFFRE